MSVIGIDLGNESCFIAVARGGGIETIDNDYSMRATPSFVAFGDHSRSLGVSAKNQAVTNLKNTVSGFKRLLGRPYADPIVQKMLPYLPFEIVGTATGGVGIRVKYLDNFCVFTPEQITAMLFTKLKETAEKAINSKVTDCVVSVPSYFTECERRALLDSAKIAGLNILRLLNETAAAALTYGIYKQDLPEPEDPKPRIVAIVDFGHSALQVSITAFHKGKLRVLATASDPFLGGRNFNRKLANHFCADFRNRYRVKVEGNKRAYLRLLAEVEKLKKQMSAAGTRMPLSIESLMEETDVEGALCRDQFEDMCWGLFGRVEKVLERCLVESRVEKEEIHSVEVIGGSTRIPKVKELIEKVFGKGVSTTLNQDEAVAIGCGLMCALISPMKTLREYELRDVLGYGIKVVWDTTLGQDGERKVFQRGCVVPLRGLIKFVRKGALGLSAEYVGDGWGEEGWVPWATRSIGKWRVEWEGVRDGGEPLRLEVECEVDENGIFGVVGAEVWERVEEETLVMQGGRGSGGMEGKEEGELRAMEGEEWNEETKVKVKEVVYKMKELKVKGITFGLGRDELEKRIKEEVRMVYQDESEKERQDKRNELEEYLYEMKGKLREQSGGELVEYSERSEREGLLEVLKEVEEWLYDSGSVQAKEVYQDKLVELKGKGDPIKERKLEAEGRPTALRAVEGLLDKGRMMVTRWRNNEPQYLHILAGDMGKLEKTVKEMEGWLDGTKMKFGGNWEKWMEVPVKMDEILGKAKELEGKIKWVEGGAKVEENGPNANSSQQSGGKKMSGFQESMDVE